MSNDQTPYQSVPGGYPGQSGFLPGASANLPEEPKKTIFGKRSKKYSSRL